MRGAQLLIVEDEAELLKSLGRGLAEEGFAVTCAGSAEAAEKFLAEQTFDAIVLDLRLPGKNGIDFLREMRATGNLTPVLVLTARGSLDDRVIGLDSGADDYLVKPFAFAELLARLRALARRERSALGARLQVGELVLDTTTREVFRQGQAIGLTSKEHALLEYLMRHPNQVLTRTMIAEHVWNYDFDNATNVIDVHVRNLRRKMDDPFPNKLLHTVRGAGYRISDRPAE